MGERVAELAPGDYVLPIFIGECKECAHCKSEESNMYDLLLINPLLREWHACLPFS
jgi:alcohol dehydrogenase class-P